MTESVDVFSGPAIAPTATSGFAPGEIATLPCGRCLRPQLPWDLRTFADKQICGRCYQATIELATGAMKALPVKEQGRLCANCRATRDPSLGSAWCRVLELGDERARICANFVPLALVQARTEVESGRVEAIDVWRAASDELRGSLGEGNYRTWLDQIEVVELNGDELVLAVPDDYTRSWLEQRLQPVIANALSIVGYAHIRPTYIVEESHAPETPAPARESKAGFNPHYTFAEFIVGSGNRLAHASALASVDRPGQIYNPLVLYGGVGIGKTHLLQAIGQEAIDQGKGRVLYTTSESFTNELIAAIRDGTTNEFRDRYRSVDFLLLDDVQFIAGKEATQEEFFHTFNALHQAGKQIVLTSDRPPTELKVLEARLRSRFEWGMMADMQPPDLETRIAIARAKAAVRGRRLPETVLNSLATRSVSNVRELEGALNRIFALSDMMGTEPGIEIASRVLGDVSPSAGGCSPADVLQVVSAYYRVKASDLAGQQRERRITYARQMAMYLLREEAKLSLVEVGHHLGGRNHSTVIYSCEKVAESRNRGRVKQDLQALKQMLYGAA